MKRDRMEWLCFIVAIAVIGVVFVSMQRSDFANRVASERMRLDVLGGVLAAQVGTNLASVDRALRGVLQDHARPGAAPDPQAVNRRLQALQQAMPQVRGFTLIDAAGKVVGATPGDLIGRNFGERPYFTTVRERPAADIVYVSAPFVSVRGDLVVSITRMIAGPGGRFDGIVSAVLDPAYFASLFRTVLYASDVNAFLVHGDGPQLFRVGAPAAGGGTTLVRPVSAAGMKMDKTLSIGIARDAGAIVAPLWRQYQLYALLLAAAQVAAAALLRWAQLRRRHAEQRSAEQMRERLRADALRQSEARFRTLIEEAPVAVAILRAGKFIYTNRRYNLLHGYPGGADLSGMAWREMIAPASRLLLQAEEAAIGADAPREQRFEALGLGQDASLVPVFKSTTRVELVDGAATLIFVQDISAQKRAEAGLLEARDAAEAANRSKADFLANMSHEIRTPLNAILGLAYLLDQPGLGAEAQEMLLKIRQSGKSLLGIINDILDVSKIDAGQMTIETAWFSLQDVLDSVAATMGVAVGDKDIDLLVHPLPEGITSLLGDALRLEQILSNLASNAIKFTGRGRVELSVTAHSRERDQAVLRFAVRDTGIGIDPALQDAVFAPFTQADSSTTRRFGGSGLGLAICKKLVALLGGEIGLDSTPGTGSQFWFTLPFQYATAPSSPEMAELHVLIAHDDEHVLASLAGTAAALGWRVSTVASSAAAIARVCGAAPAERPDVVVLNRSSNEGGAVAAAVALRACLPPRQCPVLILTTTFDLAALAAGADAAAVDAFLTKPVTASTLYNAVIEARRKRSAAAPSAPAVARPIHTSLAGIRLLVVDDSEINRDVARRILRGEGAEVVLAADGRAAIDWLLAQPDQVDLVLMDVQMPVLDGIGACRILRAMPQFDDLPIVALTAGAFQSQQDAAHAAGMSEFITKPFDIPRTIGLIRRLHRPPGAGGAGATLDLARALALWGDLDTYHAYLDKFARAYGAALPALRAAPATEAAALAHQMAGAAGNVALPAVAAAALAAERALADGLAPAPALATLERALARALAAITQRCTPALAQAPMVKMVPMVPMAGAPVPGALLDALMAALNGDNPAPAQPLLAALARALGAAPLDAVAAALERFDFRGAEAATRKLAADLRHPLKEAS